MAFVLVRVDDRLIHGQVVVGWARALRPDRIILCDDEIAASDWEKDLYLNSYADVDVALNVFSEDELLKYVNSPDFEKEKVLLVVASPKVVWQLVEKGVPIKNVNIGGLHYKENARKIAPYIFVSEEDVNFLKKLSARGISIEGRDVPQAKVLDVMELIGKAGL